MSKHRQLLEGARLPQDWLDAIQEFISTMASPNFVITILTTTSLRVAAGAGNAQVTIGINGKWRYNSANADAAAPGGLATGDNPIFVAASDNSFSTNPTPPPTDLDSTDYSFRLILKPAGQTPSGTGTEALYRQVGVATWDGTQITDVRQTVGGQALPKHAASHNPTGSDALNWPAIAQVIGLYGTLAARPAAAAGNRGYRYFATDVNGGTLYVNNDGTTWVKAALGATEQPSNTTIAQAILLFGTLAARPAAAGGNQGFYYFASDVNLGTIYQNQSGSAWVAITAGISQAVKRFSQTVGDGASTSIAVTHSLNTQDVAVAVRSMTSPFSLVYPDVQVTDANTVTVVFSVAPASNAYRVTVLA